MWSVLVFLGAALVGACIELLWMREDRKRYPWHGQPRCGIASGVAESMAKWGDPVGRFDPVAWRAGLKRYAEGSHWHASPDALEVARLRALIAEVVQSEHVLPVALYNKLVREIRAHPGSAPT